MLFFKLVNKPYRKKKDYNILINQMMKDITEKNMSLKK
jgi:hypothetical protein